MVNEHAGRIVHVFAWGVEEEHVQPNIVKTLQEVKTLLKGASATFVSSDRQEVSDDVVKRTLPFLPSTIQAMIQVQRTMRTVL